MLEQNRLRDFQWRCSNSRIFCEAIFPCFDAAGQVQAILVETNQWGWLLAPVGRLRLVSGDLNFDGRLEDLYRVGETTGGRLDGLFLFDPWGATRSGLPLPVAKALAQGNLAGRTFQGHPLHTIWFDEGLTRVEGAEAGNVLWRRRLSADALLQWLSAHPEPADTSGSLLAAPKSRDLSLYSPGEGPLLRIAPSHRVGRCEDVIGRPPQEWESASLIKSPGNRVSQASRDEVALGPEISAPTRGNQPTVETPPLQTGQVQAVPVAPAPSQPVTAVPMSPPPPRPQPRQQRRSRQNSAAEPIAKALDQIRRKMGP